MWTIVNALESTLVVTGVGFLADFVRNLGPRLVYSSTRAIPVEIPDKRISTGAYEVRVRNDSRKKAETITLHLQASSAQLRLKSYSAPAGLKLSAEADGDGIKFPLSYLKPADMLRLHVVAEGYYVPQSLDISVSSPNKITAKSVVDVEESRPFLRYTYRAFIGIAAVLVIFNAGRASQLIETPAPQAFELNRRQIMVSAAADSRLPSLASAIAATYDPTYYEGGDLAFSFAASSPKAQEIEKYRRFISLTLGNAVGMAPESQASLFYSLGRIDLLLSDEKSAIADFKVSISKSRSIVEVRLNSDSGVREFLTQKGLI